MNLFKASIGDKIKIKSLDGVIKLNLVPKKILLRAGEIYKVEDLSSGAVLSRGGRLIALGRELVEVIEVEFEDSNHR